MKTVDTCYYRFVGITTRKNSALNFVTPNKNQRMRKREVQGHQTRIYTGVDTFSSSYSTAVYAVQ